MIGRRGFLKGLLGAILAGLATSAYGFYVEPALELTIRRWQVRSKHWPADLPLKIAVLTDIHACDPYMGVARIERIVAQTNALGADLIVILGDLPGASRFIRRVVPARESAPPLGALRAPLGVFAVLGNHDWWHDRTAQRRGHGPTEVGLALEAAGIPVLQNQVIRLGQGAQSFWLAGLGDQLAFRFQRARFGGKRGVDDLPGTMAQITDDRPVILLAHEPDIFPEVPERVALTLSGHTHGGQVRLFGYSPITPSRFGNRYAYGVVEERGHHLVVSGGLGFTQIPVRFGIPPEITLIELSA